MSKSPNQKLKLLYLQKILVDQTDDEHLMTVAEMISALSQCGISSERKSIYHDLELLQQFGLDLQSHRRQTTGWFVGERTFQMAELKLLVDVVQSSRFLTEKKSASLIQKLAGFSSNHQSHQLRRQVFVSGRAKTMNERIYYNVDKLHTAISGKQSITFRYFDYNATKTKTFRREGKRYVISPFGLIWNSDNYYLVGFDSQRGQLRHYRVDKMAEIVITSLPLDGQAQYPNFNLATYSERHFGMFAGEPCTVILRCNNSIAGVILDRFGQECNISTDGDTHFIAQLPVVLSPQFFGWLFGLEHNAHIIAPESAVVAYTKKLTALTEAYRAKKP